MHSVRVSHTHATGLCVYRYSTAALLRRGVAVRMQRLSGNKRLNGIWWAVFPVYHTLSFFSTQRAANSTWTCTSYYHSVLSGLGHSAESHWFVRVSLKNEIFICSYECSPKEDAQESHKQDMLAPADDSGHWFLMKKHRGGDVLQSVSLPWVLYASFSLTPCVSRWHIPLLEGLKRKCDKFWYKEHIGAFKRNSISQNARENKSSFDLGK